MAPKSGSNGRHSPLNGRPAPRLAKPKKEGTRGNVGGRPRVEIDWAVFDALCGVKCTLAEIAGHFGCSEDTIERACQRERSKGFAEYYREKAGHGTIALRRKQFQVAMNGNVTMLIWLGKQQLGQTDKQTVGGDTEAPVTIRVVREQVALVND